MGFPFCTHFIISSSTESERVRPRTSGTELGVVELRSCTPESGSSKEAFIFGYVDSIVERVFEWWLQRKKYIEVVVARCQITTTGGEAQYMKAISPCIYSEEMRRSRG